MTRRECAALVTLVTCVLAADPAAGQVRLIGAVRERNVSAVRALLKERVPVNERQSDGTTALHWATHANDVEMTDALLRAGADPNVTNRYGVPPLWLACENGNPTLIAMLLAAGADVHAETTGEPLVMTATRTGNVEAVNALLAAGAEVDARETWRGQTALMWAAAENHVGVVRLLIGRGADVNASSTAGYTPLLFAARQGTIDAAAGLIDGGADVNVIAPNGSTVLTIAISNLKYELAGLLIARGARVTSMNKSGTTPLHEIVLARNRSTGGLGIRANRRVPSGNMSSMELMARVVAAEADPNARREAQGRPGREPTLSDGSVNFGGATPFLLAAKAADSEAMRFLLANGADPLLGTLEGTTPLMVAAGIGHTADDAGMKTEPEVLEALQLALDVGNAVTAVNDHGQTALHGGVYRATNEVIRVLVDRGASLDQRDARGRTPLQLATDGFNADGHHRRDPQAALLRDLASRGK